MTVAVRPLPAPTSVLPVKVPVNHTGQGKGLPAARLVARLRRLEATRTPAVGAVESHPAGRRSSTSSRRGTTRCTCSGAAHHGANDRCDDPRRHGRAAATGGARPAAGCAESPVSGIAVVVRFVVPLALEAAARTLMVSVGAVIVCPVPTFSRPRGQEERKTSYYGYI